MRILNAFDDSEEINSVIHGLNSMLSVSLVNFVAKYPNLAEQLNIDEYRYVLCFKLLDLPPEAKNSSFADQYGNFDYDHHFINLYYVSVLRFLEEHDANLVDFFNPDTDFEYIQLEKKKLFLFIVAQFHFCRSLLSFDRGFPVQADSALKEKALDFLSTVIALEMIGTSLESLEYLLSNDCNIMRILHYFFDRQSPDPALRSGYLMFVHLGNFGRLSKTPLSVTDMVNGWYKRLGFQEATPLYVESLLDDESPSRLGQFYLLFRDWAKIYRRTEFN